MDYTLAKELKDAGFQQHLQCGHCGYDCGGQMNNVKQSTVYTPTLSELIEACGEGFNALYRKFDENGKPIDLWTANYFHRLRNKETVANGKTPLIAVARLWLALNK